MSRTPGAIRWEADVRLDYLERASWPRTGDKGGTYILSGLCCHSLYGGYRGSLDMGLPRSF